LVYFPPFWYFVPRKIGNPDGHAIKKRWFKLSRVTRLGEFSPVGCLFSLDGVFENYRDSPNFKQFFNCKSY
jgi:hypothetical protein